VRKVSRGVITTIAGNGAEGFGGDGGSAIRAEFHFPEGVAANAAAVVYVADYENHRIRISGRYYRVGLDGAALVDCVGRRLGSAPNYV